MFELIAICAATAVFTWAIYMTVIRKYALQNVRFQMHMLKAEFTLKQSQDYLGSESEAANLISRRFFDRALCFASMSTVIHGMYKEHARYKLSLERENELFHNAQGWIQEIRSRQLDLTVKATLLNSPFWFPLLTILGFGVILKTSLEKRYEDLEEYSTLAAESLERKSTT